MENLTNSLKELIPEYILLVMKEQVNRFKAELPLEEAFTPPASWYLEQRFLELEQKSCFRFPQYLGSSYHLTKEGDYLTHDIGDEPLVLIRSKEGIKAHYNVCSHHASCILEGRGNTSELVCPYHGWRYDLNGKLKKTPLAGAIREIRHKGLDLKPVRLQYAGPFLFGLPGLAPDDEVPSQALEAMEELQNELDALNLKNYEFQFRKVYDLDCNWKIFVDNYLDGGYHVPHMHPALTTQIDFDSYHTRLGKWLSVQSVETASKEHAMVQSAERFGERAHYLFMYPNFMLNQYGKWIDVNIALPRGTHGCRVIFDYFYQGSLSEEQKQKAVVDSDQVQQEDMVVCERVQKGLMSSVYDQGVYAPKFEAPMYHFHKLLHRDLLKSSES